MSVTARTAVLHPNDRARTTLGFLALALATLAAIVTPRLARADGLPPNFVVEPVLQTPNFVVYPTQVAFFPDGRMLIATKGGWVWVAKNGVVHPVPVWDGVAEVNGHTDRGLLGIAIDPDFKTNRYVYFLYTAEPDSNEATLALEVFVRLTRYQMSLTDTNRVDHASRTILIGRTWTEGGLNTRPSHSAGSLRWGRDKSLLVSIGDGGHWTSVDAGGLDSIAFIPGRTDTIEDIGAYRSQFLGSLCGKILRINPHTGHGYASNPYADGNLASVRSRVYQYGIRNAYRFVVQPGTGNPDTSAGFPGVLYMGDTGWNTWEDICVADQPGLNFGWPCYEGPYENTQYTGGPQPKHSGCSSIGTPGNPGALRGPIISWSRTDSTRSEPPGYLGSVCVGGEFYTGYQYPAEYRGRFLYGEFGFQWIAMATVDEDHQLLGTQYFARPADSPVDLEVDPWTGDLYSLAIFGGPSGFGEIRRIRYTGTPGNQPPVATIDAPGGREFFASGGSSSLSGSGTDPEDSADSLVYQWKVDRQVDGQIQLDAQQPPIGATSQFVGGSGAALHEVHLIVYDTQGASDTTRVTAYPEIDLEPSPIMVAVPLTDQSKGGGPDVPAGLAFKIRNRGRMDSPAARWRLMSDDVMIAEGDTAVAGSDSVWVGVETTLATGEHVMRITVDVLGTVIEVDESDNEWVDTVLINPVDPIPPTTLALSEAFPNPGVGGTAFSIEVPTASPVVWRVFDLTGRELWSQNRNLTPGVWTLSWNGEDSEGRRARPGLYFAKVEIADRTLTRRFTLVR